MNYPKNYAVLAEEEMEYTTGGSVLGVALMVGGLAGGICGSILYNKKLDEITAGLKAQNPEEYSSDDVLTDVWKTQKLSVDAKLQLNTSPEGLALNLAQGVAGACFSFGLSEVIVSAVMKQIKG